MMCQGRSVPRSQHAPLKIIAHGHDNRLHWCMKLMPSECMASCNLCLYVSISAHRAPSIYPTNIFVYNLSIYLSSYLFVYLSIHLSLCGTVYCLLYLFLFNIPTNLRYAYLPTYLPASFPTYYLLTYTYLPTYLPT